MTKDMMEAELVRLREEVARMNDENIKYRRTMEDLLSNLEAENMPTVAKTLRRVSAEAAQIASVRQSVSDQGAQISAIAQAQGETLDSVAEVSAMADSNNAKIALVVGQNGSTPYIRTAGIVTAINNAASSVSISADKINFEGSDVRFSTDRLEVDSRGRIVFRSPLKTRGLHSETIQCDGRVDFGSFDGLTGYVYLNAGEENQLELVGDGGVLITTDSESGSNADGGDIEMHANRLKFNGKEVLTKSAADIAYLRVQLGLV